MADKKIEISVIHSGQSGGGGALGSQNPAIAATGLVKEAPANFQSPLGTPTNSNPAPVGSKAQVDSLTWMDKRNIHETNYNAILSARLTTLAQMAKLGYNPQAGGGVVPGGGGSGATNANSILGGLGFAAAAGALNKAAMMGINAIAQTGNLANIAGGQGIAGFSSAFIRNGLSGNAFTNAIFQQQRNQALGLAEDQERWAPIKDILGSITKPLIGAGGAAIATGGNPFAIGAGVIGGIGALSDTERSIWTSSEDYKKFAAAREAQSFQAQFGALKAQDPLGTAIKENLIERRLQYRDFQRSLGLGDKGLSSFLMQSGFTQDDLMQAATGISGAGGSTRAARGLSGYANSLMAANDITNASQLVGTISGALGKSDETRTAFEKMLIRSFSTVFGSGGYENERNKMFAIGTQLAYGAGAKDASGFAAVSNKFQDMASIDPTMRGLGAAQQAWQAYQSTTTGGGVFGALRFAGMFKGQSTGKIGYGSQLAFGAEYSEAELSALPLSDIGLRAAAQKAGVSPQEMRAALLSNSRGAANTFVQGNIDSINRKFSDKFGKNAQKDWKKIFNDPDFLNDLGTMRNFETNFLHLKGSAADEDIAQRLGFTNFGKRGGSGGAGRLGEKASALSAGEEKTGIAGLTAEMTKSNIQMGRQTDATHLAITALHHFTDALLNSLSKAKTREQQDTAMEIHGSRVTHQSLTIDPKLRKAEAIQREKDQRSANPEPGTLGF